MNRNRLLYFFLIFLTIAMGLISRMFGEDSVSWTTLYLGDALWALMVFFGFGFLFKRKSTLWVAGVSLLFSFGIEFSQFCHAPWIDAIRSTRIGGLILGFGFLWSDLACYTAGVLAGSLFESILYAKK